MSDIQHSMTTDECTFDLVFAFMLPLFLASAGGNLPLARISIIELLCAYEAATPAEIELVARIISFSHIALDGLSRSMRPELTDAMVLRYRGNATAMQRAAEQCRKTLEAMQARRMAAEASRTMPHPPHPPKPEMPRPPTPRVPTPPPQPKPHAHNAHADSMAAEIAATTVQTGVARLARRPATTAASRTNADAAPQAPAAARPPHASPAVRPPRAAAAASQLHAAAGASQSHPAIAATPTQAAAAAKQSRPVVSAAISAAMLDAEAILAGFQFRLATTDTSATPAARPQVPPDAPAFG